MSLFLVVSEELSETVPILDYGQGPLEYYRIVELVVADTREQARWTAWTQQEKFSCDIRDMPNFRTRKLSNRHPESRGVVSDRPAFSEFWNHPEALSLFHSLDK